MLTFDVDNYFKNRVREIAVQLGELVNGGPPFSADSIIGVTVEFEKNNEAHKVFFPAHKVIHAVR